MCRPLFLLVLLAALGCQPPTTTPDEYYEQATTAFRDKQDRHALDLIKRGQRAASSSNAVAWNWRFRLLEAEIRARDRDETSLRQTLALLEPAPSMDAIPRELEPRRWMLRGKILKDLRQWDLARESLDRAHALASEHGANALLGEIEIRRAEWHFERGSTREAEARVAEAIALLEEALFSLNKALFIGKRNQNCSFPRKSSPVQIDIKVVWEELFQSVLCQMSVLWWQE